MNFADYVSYCISTNYQVDPPGRGGPPPGLRVAGPGASRGAANPAGPSPSAAV